jgi:lysylphosphatidylglycerol synthetase-like protein (DUF2156 family)
MEMTARKQTAEAMATALTEKIATEAMKRLTLTQIIMRAPAWVFWVTGLSLIILGGFAMILPEYVEPLWLDMMTDPIHHWWAGIIGY